MRRELDGYIVVITHLGPIIGKRVVGEVLSGLVLEEPRHLQFVQQGNQTGLLLSVLPGAPCRLQLPSSSSWFYPTDEKLVKSYVETTSTIKIVGGIN